MALIRLGPTRAAELHEQLLAHAAAEFGMTGPLINIGPG